MYLEFRDGRVLPRPPCSSQGSVRSLPDLHDPGGSPFPWEGGGVSHTAGGTGGGNPISLIVGPLRDVGKSTFNHFGMLQKFHLILPWGQNLTPGLLIWINFLRGIVQAGGETPSIRLFFGGVAARA